MDLVIIENKSNSSRELDLPGQHPSKTCPRASGDEEAHCGVRNGVPCSANKQDDGCIEGIQLPKEKKRRLVQLWL